MGITAGGFRPPLLGSPLHYFPRIRCSSGRRSSNNNHQCCDAVTDTHSDSDSVSFGGGSECQNARSSNDRGVRSDPGADWHSLAADGTFPIGGSSHSLFKRPGPTT